MCSLSIHRRVFTEAVGYMRQTLRPDAYGACASRTEHSSCSSRSSSLARRTQIAQPCIAKFAVDKQRADRGWDQF